MTKTQERAIEDLEYIIEIAQNLIKQLKNNEIDDIDSAAREIYYDISKLEW